FSFLVANSMLSPNPDPSHAKKDEHEVVNRYEDGTEHTQKHQPEKQQEPVGPDLIVSFRHRSRQQLLEYMASIKRRHGYQVKHSKPYVEQKHHTQKYTERSHECALVVERLNQCVVPAAWKHQTHGDQRLDNNKSDRRKNEVTDWTGGRHHNVGFGFVAPSERIGLHRLGPSEKWN